MSGNAFARGGGAVAAWVFMAACAAAAPACDLKAADAARAGPNCARAWMDANLKLNDLLTVGTHNSYKTRPPEAVLALVRKLAPGRADEIDYGHRPLSEQLDAGARQLEIDVYNDPEGGRFLDPLALKVAGVALDPARRAALAEPGFKVMHVQDVDVLSVCETLRDCLGAVRRWSLAHPDHAPILLMFNAKTDPPPPGGTTALPFDAAAFDALDREVRAVFPPSELITPDDVQGAFPTLRDAVLHGGWPTLGQARGKVLFALDEDADKVAVYRGKRRSLEGRVFFVNTDEASPAAAYLTLNDPIADAERIRKAVAAGFIVRTRADSGTVEARANDPRRREAALASGAQFVSTDYLWPEPRLGNAYQVRLPAGAAAVCNPVRGAGRCAGLAVEVAEPPETAAYLSPEATPDGLRILAPPPVAGSPVALADRQVFEATRALRGSPRWTAATSDVDTDASTHFACALGVRLTAQAAPALARLLDRAETSGVVDPVKRFYRAKRPYLGTKAPICQPRTAELAANGDYPSGHAANGWMEALILAELAPDRASEILARGRAFGESRVVCGVHSQSAVQAGWLAGAAATAALHGSAAFRADLEAARAELSRIRETAAAPDPAFCRDEARALAQPSPASSR